MATARKQPEKFSYSDYLKWDDDKRWELINGVAYDMTPAPSFRHQIVVGNLYRKIADMLEGTQCVVGIAPVDIVLSEADVVQPDIFVVCDRGKITDEVIKGAPDVVIEVLSPATSLKDRREKKQLYEWSGVREYLLVDPDGKYVERFHLQEDGAFSSGKLFDPEDMLPFVALPDVEVKLSDIFKI